jgi:hypothetical protein
MLAEGWVTWVSWLRDPGGFFIGFLCNINFRQEVPSGTPSSSKQMTSLQLLEQVTPLRVTLTINDR